MTPNQHWGGANTRAVEQHLVARKLLLPSDADGEIKAKELDAAADLLRTLKIDPTGWTGARRIIAVEQAAYRAAGIEVGEIDGFAGPQTRHARTVFTARGLGAAAEKAVTTWRDGEADATPIRPLPAAAARWPHQREMERFYGPPGEANLVSMTLPYTMRFSWIPDSVVRTLRVNKRCKEAFETLLERTLAIYGLAELRRLRLDITGGIYAYRKMRGGSEWSTHAYGAAIDIDPDRNALHMKRQQATLDNEPYRLFWQIVAELGLISLGQARDYDWMHIQAARIGP